MQEFTYGVIIGFVAVALFALIKFSIVTVAKFNDPDESVYVSNRGSFQIMRGSGNVVQTSVNGRSTATINGLSITGATGGVSLGGVNNNVIQNLTMGGVTIKNCDISGLKGSISIEELKVHCENK